MHAITSTALSIALAVATMAPARVIADGFPDYRGQGTLFGGAWDPAAAIGELRSTHARQSASGARAYVRFGLTPALALGATGAWNNFSVDAPPGEKRSLETYSALATAHWFLARETVQPFVALGAGWAHRKWNDAYSDNGLVVEPQLGVLLTMAKGGALELALHYDFHVTRYASAVGPSGAPRRSFPQWVGLSVGFDLY